jgi:hypothetical protein
MGGFVQQQSDSRSPATSFGYPTTTFVFVIGNDGAAFHDMRGTGDPTLTHANAPNGSRYWDYTNLYLYYKSGTPGGTDGTWVKSTIYA